MSGNLQSMRVILRNNLMMLRERGLFINDRSYLYKKNEYLHAAKEDFDFKTISKSELATLRKRVLKKRKSENVKAWLIALVIVVPMVVYGLVEINTYNKKKKQKAYKQQIKNEKAKQLLIQQGLDKDFKEYLYVIEDGDQWIEKGNWHNAIYRYKQAVTLFPAAYEANYRLALAYSYNCQYKHIDCVIGQKLTNKLITYFPEKANLQTLKKIFEKSN